MKRDGQPLFVIFLIYFTSRLYVFFTMFKCHLKAGLASVLIEQATLSPSHTTGHTGKHPAVRSNAFAEAQAYTFYSHDLCLLFSCLSSGASSGRDSHVRFRQMV